MLDVDVQVLCRVRIQRRGKNAAVTQSARAELHAALHPGNDLVVVQGANGQIYQFAFGQQITEAQLAIFDHFLDLLRRISGPEAERFERHALRSTIKIVPGVKGGAECRSRIACHGLNEYMS